MRLFAVEQPLLLPCLQKPVYTDGVLSVDLYGINHSFLNICLRDFFLRAVKAGIQPGFLLKAKNNDVDVKAAYKKADVAVPVGVSYLFNCGLILDARYNIGLTSLAKDKDIVTRNSVFAVTAGWRF